eukprot:gene1683-4808_t
MAAAFRQGRTNVAIVGGGPSGFYLAQYLLKAAGATLARVDMFERLPAPFGLVRYGVAPDHPEVKNCISQFETVAKHPSFSFFGNTPIGKSHGGTVELSELQSAYDAVVLAYGTSLEQRLNIPGEGLRNVVSAREFVGWYNGHPDHQNLAIDWQSVDTAAIIGVGNVALDCARMLLATPDYLKNTDITETSRNMLASAATTNVIVLGRRGPLEAAFTIKELRELSKLEDVTTRVSPGDISFSQEEERYVSSTRRLTRMMRLLQSLASDSEIPSVRKICNIRFFLSPIKILEDKEKPGNVGSIVCRVMSLDGRPGHRTAVPTNATIEIPTNLVIKSIRYKGVALDSTIPFDNRRNTIQHDGVGRIAGMQRVYCSGWIKNGPEGTIATTMMDANNTALAIASDLKQHVIGAQDAQDRSDLRRILLQRIGETAVNFKQWKSLESYEKEKGIELGKPAEKCTNIQQMLSVCHGTTADT